MAFSHVTKINTRPKEMQSVSHKVDVIRAGGDLYKLLVLPQIVFSLSVASTTFYMTRKQVVSKPDWTSRKCSDVHRPHVQDRKADSPKLLFKLRQTVSLQEWWGRPIYVIRY